MNTAYLRRAACGLLSALIILMAGCGGSGGRPQLLGATPRAEVSGFPPLEAEYRLQPGDEVRIVIVGNDEMSTTVPVRPDGRISAPGVGDLQAGGRTIAVLTEELRAQLRRLIRYPDVSVMLVKHAEQVVYVMGEVSAPGAKPYVPSMTTLHAIGSAGGPSKTGKTSSVIVLRRTGPDELEVYQVDIEAALDGKATARDFCLKPYDLVYVPRTFIANLNLFMDQYVRQNVIPFTAYIDGWRAFHASEIFWRQTGTP